VDVSAPDGLSPELASTRIAWGGLIYLDGSSVVSASGPLDRLGILSPSGRYLTYVTRFDLRDQIEWLDLETGEHRVLVVKDDVFPGAVSLAGLAFAPDEQTVVFEVDWSNRVNVASVTVADGDLELIYSRGGANTFPTVSPDGRSILVSCDSEDPEGFWALCIIDRETGRRRQLTDDQGLDPVYGGLFAPGGRTVAYFTSPRTLEWDARVYRVGIDGEGKELLVSGLTPGGALLAITSEDVVFPCSSAEQPACSWVCVVGLDGADVRRLTYLGERCVDVGTP
jgi:Tol biopolymer transport system component